ncbi:uncharacterized protein V1518DRAFT_379877 [Limtongia smithiae]|uniref:uncharacterized protein n=1 Tax=Limtongia smithiae TaxID=1125753 RepID=UPI0034CE18CE
MSHRELEEYQFQLAAVNENLATDPNNDSLKTLKSELSDLIALLETSHTESQQYPVPAHASTESSLHAKTTLELSSTISAGHTQTHHSPPASSTLTSPSSPLPPSRSSLLTPPPPPSPPPPPPPTAASPANSAPPPPPSLPTQQSLFRPGDIVLARWLSGDKQYTRGKIAGITGSSDKPMFTVKFFDNNSIDTMPISCIRAIEPEKSRPESNKRSATEASVTDSAEEQARTPVKYQSKSSLRSERKRVLDQGKQKWQAFASKGVKASGYSKSKAIGEASMFRSPDAVDGRVGVMNSGKPMSKEYKRAKHVYSNPQT